MDIDTIEAELRDFIELVILDEPGAGIRSDTRLLELGILDSLAMTELVAFLEAKYQARIPPDAVTAENFQCPGRIAAYLCRLLRQKGGSDAAA